MTAKHIEFLVEELSAEEALKILIPKILGQRVSFSVHSYGGKQNLLEKLPGRLLGYKHWLPDDWKIVVLIDADDDDCRTLKATLEKFASDAGLKTKSNRGAGSQFQVLNRLAIEELEAWFFGDVPALHAAYHRINVNLGKKAKFRKPDSISGGTWESLERELQKVGYYPGGYLKIRGAREIAAHMVPQINHSKSFQVFRDGLLSL